MKSREFFKYSLLTVVLLSVPGCFNEQRKIESSDKEESSAEKSSNEDNVASPTEDTEEEILRKLIELDSVDINEAMIPETIKFQVDQLTLKLSQNSQLLRIIDAKCDGQPSLIFEGSVIDCSVKKKKELIETVELHDRELQKLVDEYFTDPLK